MDNHLTARELAHPVVRLGNVDATGKTLLKARRPKVYLADTSLRTAIPMQGGERLVDSTPWASWPGSAWRCDRCPSRNAARRRPDTGATA